MLVRRLTVLLLFVVVAPSVFAQLPRVFVVSNGTDAGTCARTAPCRNFAYAMTQVAVGGEVVALDTAGYGPVTITQSVSIYAAPGAVASITAGAGNDITINGPVGTKVMIRGLFLTSNGSAKGISFDGGSVLTVQDTTFTNFATNAALDVERPPAGPTDAPRVFVSNCRFLSNLQGIYAWSGNTTPIRLSVRNSQFENTNSEAIVVADYVRATVTDSSFVSGGAGINVAPSSAVAGAAADATIERCTFFDNATGISASGGGNAPGIARLAYCMITNNAAGLNQSSGGAIQSRADGTGNQTNTLENNTAGNTFPGTYAAK